MAMNTTDMDQNHWHVVTDLVQVIPFSFVEVFGQTVCMTCAPIYFARDTLYLFISLRNHLIMLAYVSGDDSVVKASISGTLTVLSMIWRLWV